LLAASGDDDPPRERLDRVERILADELKMRGVKRGDVERTPSAAAGVARATAGRLEVAVLGDVTVVVETDGRCVAITDARIARFDARAVALLKKLLGSGMGYAEAWPSVRAVLREHRLRMNSDDTYWILGSHPDSATHAVTCEFSPKSSARLLLATDGLARIIEPFRLYAHWCAVLDAVAGSSVKHVLANLRAAEKSDPECRRFPRLTPMDDATGLYVELRRHDGSA
jgi:hypothetical protein